MTALHFDVKTRFDSLLIVPTRRVSLATMGMADVNSAWSGARAGFLQVCIASADGRDLDQKSPPTVLRNVRNQDLWALGKKRIAGRML